MCKRLLTAGARMQCELALQKVLNVKTPTRSAIDLPNDDAIAWENNDVVWILTDDSPDSPSKVASTVPGVIQVCQGASPRERLTALVPTDQLEDGRAYRLYAFVRDHAAESSTECLPPEDDSDCDEAVRWIMSEGTNLHADWYPGLSPASSYTEVQGYLHESGKCPAPCPGRKGVTEAQMNIPFRVCHDSVFPEPCAREVRKLEEHLSTDPASLPDLSPKSTSQARKKSHGVCISPNLKRSRELVASALGPSSLVSPGAAGLPPRQITRPLPSSLRFLQRTSAADTSRVGSWETRRTACLHSCR